MTALNAMRTALLPLLVAGILSACPSEPVVLPEIPPPPRIVSFTLSAAEVEAGAQVTLTWQTADATGVDVRDAAKGSVSGGDALSGSATVTIVEDTLFVLTASNERGVRESLARVVTVRGAEREVLFIASPTRVLAGESVVLAWSAPGAAEVDLRPEGGEAIDLGGQLAFGSVEYAPIADTRFILTVDKKRAVEANVDVAPKIDALLAAPSPVERGEQLKISWKTTGAERVTVVGAGRGLLFEEANSSRVADGSFTETVPTTADPGAARSYLVRAHAADGAITERPVTVFVGGAPTVAEWNVPALAPATLTFEASWRTTGAETVEILKDGMPVFQSGAREVAAAGTVTLVTPETTAVYVLRAMDSRGAVTVSEPKTVEPVGLPAVVTFTASPQPGIADGGDAVTLTWDVTNARNVKIVAVDQYTVTQLSGTGAAAGSVITYPNEDTEYVLTADNGIGNQIVPVTANVTVANPARLLFNPAIAPLGTSVQVTGTTIGTADIHGLPTVELNATGAAFIDISSTGVDTDYCSSCNFTSEENTLPEPFYMTLFGQTVGGNQISVNVNGWFFFGTSSVSHDTPITLPTTVLEPFAFVPFFDDHVDTSTGEIFYQLDDLGTEKRLIVQWDQIEYDPPAAGASLLTFQVQLYESGRVVFAYDAITGYTGTPAIGILNGDETDALVFNGAMPSAGDTITFFGTSTLPATIQVRAMPLVVRQDMGNGAFIQIEQASPVILPGQIAITEMNANPVAGVVDGEWIEIANTTAQPIDISGWTLDFGGGSTHTIASGTSVPASGYLVLGQSSTAGDGVAVGYDYGNTLAIGASGIKLAVSGTAFNALVPPAGGTLAAGRAWQRGPPATGLTTVAGVSSLDCPAAPTATYGTNGQLGTPGAANSACPRYALQTGITANFESIALTGTQLVFANSDDDIATVNLATPIVVDGLSYSSIVVGINGYISVVPLLCDDAFCYSTNKAALNPGTTPTGVIAPFWDDNDTTQYGGVYWERKTPGVTPNDGYTIVSWENVHHFTSGTATESMNFQVKLFDTGNIEFHFGSMSGTGTTPWHTGVSATTWFEHPSATAAFIVNVNSSTSPGIASNTAHRLVAQ